ncbi:MAG: hypothetical protein JXN65_10250 [Clostridia bacterium]|nr:hypothetical protein [Clostridia bacterium]
MLILTFKNSEHININKLHDELKEVLKYEFIMPFTESTFNIEIEELKEGCAEKENIESQILTAIASHDPTAEEPITEEERLDQQELLILQLYEVINNA